MNRQLLDVRDFVNASPEAVEAELRPDSPAVCVACNRYGSLLAVGCGNGDVVMYDMMTRSAAATMALFSTEQKLEGQGSAVVALSWSRNGRRLAMGTASGRVALWSVADSTLAATHDFGAEVTGVTLGSSPSERVLVTLSAGNAQLWPTAAAEALEVPFPSTSGGRVFGAIDRSGQHIVLASEKGLVALYTAEPLALLDVVKGPNAIRALTLNERGTSALVIGSSSIRQVFVTPPTLEHASTSFSASSDVERAEALKGGESLRGGDALLRLDPTEFKEAMDNVRWRCAQVSRDGEYVLGGADAKERHLIYLWDRPTGRLLRVLEGPLVGLSAVVWHPSPYRQILLSVTGAGRVFIWAHIIKENWEVFAPGFRSLEKNVEYVESETEFDLNPDPGKVVEVVHDEEEPVDVSGVAPIDRKIFDSDTEDDVTGYLRSLPLRLDPPGADMDENEDGGNEADPGGGVKRQKV